MCAAAMPCSSPMTAGSHRRHQVAVGCSADAHGGRSLTQEGFASSSGSSNSVSSSSVSSVTGGPPSCRQRHTDCQEVFLEGRTCPRLIICPAGSQLMPQPTLATGCCMVVSLQPHSSVCCSPETCPGTRDSLLTFGSTCAVSSKSADCGRVLSSCTVWVWYSVSTQMCCRFVGAPQASRAGNSTYNSQGLCL